MILYVNGKKIHRVTQLQGYSIKPVGISALERFKEPEIAGIRDVVNFSVLGTG